jgi:uncharacterized protein with beta-barrel porin domain
MISFDHHAASPMTMRVLRTALLMSAVLGAAAAVSPASADVNTIPVWNGSDSISSWGVPDTATYGQTFTASTLQGRLTTFTVNLGLNTGVAPQYQAYLYAWDGTKITGSALYTSMIYTAPSASTFTALTFNPGGILLTPGQQYVFFLTTSTITGQSNGTYRWGSVDGATYTDGQFVFMNNGTTFSDLSTNNWSLYTTYDLAFSAELTPLSIAALLPGGAPINPTNVAEGIDNAVLNHGGNPTGGLATLYGLTGQALSNALAQVSGEAGADLATNAVDMLNPFITTLAQRFGDLSRPLSDPSMAGGGLAPVVAGGSGALNPGAAPQASALTPSTGTASALTPASPEPAEYVYGPKRVWGALIGGTNGTTGESSVLGSHSVRTKNLAIAVGMDLSIGDDALIGGAVSWGRADFKLGQSLGTGGSNAWQIGVYGTKRFCENAYVSVVGAAGFHDMKTSRYVTISGTDHLVGDVSAQIYAGRIEGGYRFEHQSVNLTPYAALQIEGFTAPAYRERAASGSSVFALHYESQDYTNLRTELGVSFDRDIAAVNDGTIHFFGRTAWVHNEASDVRTDASIIALSNSEFTVYGADPSRDAWLVSLGAQLIGTNGLVVAANVNGLFGGETTSVYGAVKVSYTW